MMNKQDVREIMLRAAAKPHGLLLRVSSPQRFRQFFYPLRKEELLTQLTLREVEGAEGNVQIVNTPKGATTWPDD